MPIPIFTGESPFLAAIRSAAKLEAVSGLFSHPSQGRARNLLSSSRQLTQLCAACFWASMEIEERREVRGSLAICSPYPGVVARCLSDEDPVSVSTLVSLLTASPNIPLAVHGGSYGPVIWGMLDSGATNLITVRITGNGALQVSHAGLVLALFHKGKTYTPRAADLRTLSCLMAQTIGHERFTAFKREAPARIIRIVTTMIRHKHGGLLVIVEPGDTSWQRSVRFKYAFDMRGGSETALGCEHDNVACGTLAVNGEDGSGTALCSEYDGLGAFDDAVDHFMQSHDPMCSHIGELGLVDGAVVIDSMFNIYGFGAKLELENSRFPLAELDAVTGSIRDGLSLAHLGGMRHQSAANFVNDHRNTDVFAVSQDGSVSLFCWSEKIKRVVVIHNLEHFLW